MHVRAARLPVSPLSVRLGDSFEGARLNSFGRVVPVRALQGGSGEGAPGRTSPYQKMLSCDPRLALCTFVQLVFRTLPCPFFLVSRLRACVTQ